MYSPRVLLVLIPELLPKALPKLQDKGKQLGRDRYRTNKQQWPLMISMEIREFNISDI